MFIKAQALKKHQGFVRYFKNTSWMLAEQMLRIISGLFVGVWIARYLGPEQFGILSYVIAFTSIFGGIAKLGLDAVMVRELVNNPEKRDIYLGTAFWLKVLGAFIVMGLIGIIVPFTSNDPRTNVFIFIIAAGLIFQSFEVVEFYFQSQVRAKIVSTCKIIQLVSSSLIKIYFISVGAELIYFVVIVAFDVFALAVSYSIAYKINGNRDFYKCFNIGVAKKLLHSSWPLMLSAVVVIIYMRIDQIMIKEMLGEYEAGIYSAAIKLSEIFYFIPILITTSLFPAILASKKESEKLYKKRLQWLYTLMFWMAMFIIIPIFFLSNKIIVTIFGAPYQAAGQVIMVHVWASIFVFWGVASGKWFLVENLQVLFLVNTAFGAGINVLLNYKLIPIYGITGAAYATLVSYAVAAYFMNFIFVKTRANFYLLSYSIFPLWKQK